MGILIPEQSTSHHLWWCGLIPSAAASLPRAVVSFFLGDGGFIDSRYHLRRVSVYSEIRRGFFTALPIMMGFVPLGLILGAQMTQLGISNATAYLMTASNFAGGSEFAAIGLWAAVPPVLLIAFTTFLINSRHIIMGASLAPYIRAESGLRIFFIYFVLCDETWALSMQDIQRRQQEGKCFSFFFHMGVGLSLWLCWSWTTFFGAVIGNLLGDLSHLGFAMALPATFIGLSVAMRPRKDRRDYLPIAMSFIAASASAVYIDAKYSVGFGAIGGLVTAYFLQVYKEKNEPNYGAH